MSDIVPLPGVEATDAPYEKLPTVEQLRVQLYAADCEIARLNALLSDGRYLIRRGLALLSSEGAPPA